MTTHIPNCLEKKAKKKILRQIGTNKTKQNKKAEEEGESKITGKIEWNKPEAISL
jgi:hypothetical protein